MTVQIALGLLAAAIPLTALALKLCNTVSPVQFVRLETEFKAFRREVRINLNVIKKKLENHHGSTTKTRESDSSDTTQ